MGKYSNPETERRVRHSRRVALRSTDPLGLTLPKASRDRAASARASLVREGGLAHLRQGSKALSQALYAVALELQDLWLQAKGPVQGVDWLQQRVSSGGQHVERAVVSVLDADRELRRRIHNSGIDRENAACVLAICCEGMTITAYAVELEDDAGGRRNGACARATLDRVRRMLREGLSAIADGQPAGIDSQVGPTRRRMLAWIDHTPWPIIDATNPSGEPGPDCRQPD
jgi:hypothetical protein